MLLAVKAVGSTGSEAYAGKTAKPHWVSVGSKYRSPLPLSPVERCWPRAGDSKYE